MSSILVFVPWVVPFGCSITGVPSPPLNIFSLTTYTRQSSLTLTYNSRETGRKAKCVVAMQGKVTTLTHPENPSDVKSFTYDYSYWSFDGAKEDAKGYLAKDSPKSRFSDQQTVYDDLGKGVLRNAWNGYNATLFAYGQTGSGKSWSVIAENLKLALVTNFKEIEQRMEEGTVNRTIASTNMNATSSRAHTIVGITFIQKFKNDAGQETAKQSVINLVDLAGSERVESTGATGSRLKEGAGINLSLSSLGNCIHALAEKSNGRQAKVPYRDSMLTRLLMNALGGNSKTIMIAAISPADINYDETLSTLRFGEYSRLVLLSLHPLPLLAQCLVTLPKTGAWFTYSFSTNTVHVKMKNLANGTEFVWTKEKFLSRLYMMKEMYQKYEDEDEWEKPEEEDPFQESLDTEIHIGTVQVNLQPLAYSVELKEQLEITNYKGADVGMMNLELHPCDAKGKEYTEADDKFVDSPSDLVGTAFNFKLKITSCKGLPNKYSDMYCCYKFYLDKEETKTKLISETSNPEFAHSKIYTFSPATQQLVDYLQNGILTIKVMGKQKVRRSAAQRNQGLTTKDMLKTDRHVFSRTRVVDPQKQSIIVELLLMKKTQARLQQKVDSIRKLVKEAENISRVRVSTSLLKEVLNANTPEQADLSIRKLAADSDRDGIKSGSGGSGSSVCVLL
nr:kinesin-like protein KIF28P [Cherax quadricarinatus]